MKSAAKADETDRQTPAEAAEHIALEASRLARLANVNQFSLLAYLIDMVVLEAWREASESGPDSNAADGPQLGLDGT